jgi:fibronectin type 3 domain-containing protein
VGTATLQWGAATDSRVTGYRVYWGTQPGSYRQGRGSGLAAGVANTYTIRDLPSGSTYYFAVTAHDSAGSESAYSTEASKTIR